MSLRLGRKEAYVLYFHVWGVLRDPTLWCVLHGGSLSPRHGKWGRSQILVDDARPCGRNLAAAPPTFLTIDRANSPSFWGALRPTVGEMGRWWVIKDDQEGERKFQGLAVGVTGDP